MKISLEWLAEYLPGELAAQRAADALTNGGLPVELIEQHGADTVIDVEVTSNRGDCLCHVGVARELAALLDRPTRWLTPTVKEIADQAADAVTVRIDAPALCPHYTARVIRGVKIGPSPAWMVRRLEAVGLRSINNVVDITNYVMFEMGQPLHAFDMDKLAGPAIIVRQAQAGEQLMSIDGRQRQLTPDMLVIADTRRPVALAGVMGGLESEVSDKTVTVLLESARFDPLSVRKTSRALALKSDSSYRFERQIDPTLPARASLRAAQLMVELADGELLGGLVEAGGTGYQPRKLVLRSEKLRQLLGIELSSSEVMAALLRLGFAPMANENAIDVTVPSWRLDVNLQVDLVEEVARLVGYDRIPIRQEIAIRLTPPSGEAASLATMRNVLVGSGYFESLTVGFVSDNLVRDFVPPEAKALLRADAVIRKDNAHLRPSVLPGLLEALRRNENAGTMDAKLYEIGPAFWIDAAGKVQEKRRLALAGGGQLRQLRGVIEAMLGKLNADRTLEIVPDQRPGMANGACGRICWGGQTAGYLGQIDAAIAEKLSLRQPPVAAELELAVLLEGTQHVKQLRPLPRFPAMRRDLSLVLAETVAYQGIDHLLRGLKLPDLEDVEYVTTYRGKPLEAGTKSVTVTLVFRSPTTTLTSEQVETSVQKAVETAKSQLQATLRT